MKKPPAGARHQLWRGVALGLRHHELGELWWDEAAKPCTVCKGATHWRRPRARGAATHPACEGTVFDTVTDELLARIVHHAAVSLGAMVTAMPAESSVARPIARFGTAGAGCEVCGCDYAACWIAARTWRCGEHQPSNDTYRRGRP